MAGNGLDLTGQIDISPIINGLKELAAKSRETGVSIKDMLKADPQAKELLTQFGSVKTAMSQVGAAAKELKAETKAGAAAVHEEVAARQVEEHQINSMKDLYRVERAEKRMNRFVMREGTEAVMLMTFGLSSLMGANENAEESEKKLVKSIMGGLVAFQAMTFATRALSMVLNMSSGVGMAISLVAGAAIFLKGVLGKNTEEIEKQRVEAEKLTDTFKKLSIVEQEMALEANNKRKADLERQKEEIEARHSDYGTDSEGVKVESWGKPGDDKRLKEIKEELEPLEKLNKEYERLSDDHKVVMNSILLGTFDKRSIANVKTGLELINKELDNTSDANYRSRLIVFRNEFSKLSEVMSGKDDKSTIDKGESFVERVRKQSVALEEELQRLKIKNIQDKEEAALASLDLEYKTQERRFKDALAAEEIIYKNMKPGAEKDKAGIALGTFRSNTAATQDELDKSHLDARLQTVAEFAEKRASIEDKWNQTIAENSFKAMEDGYNKKIIEIEFKYQKLIDGLNAEKDLTPESRQSKMNDLYTQRIKEISAVVTPEQQKQIDFTDNLEKSWTRVGSVMASSMMRFLGLTRQSDSALGQMLNTLMEIGMQMAASEMWKWLGTAIGIIAAPATGGTSLIPGAIGAAFSGNGTAGRLMGSISTMPNTGLTLSPTAAMQSSMTNALQNLQINLGGSVSVSQSGADLRGAITRRNVLLSKYY